MTSLAAPVQVRMVRRDGSGQIDLTPEAPPWDFSCLRSRIPKANVDISNCTTVLDRFVPYCDWVEFILGDVVAMPFLYTGTRLRDGNLTVGGVGAMKQMNRRRTPDSSSYIGQAIHVWRQLFQLADSIEPLGVTLSATGVEQGDGVTLEPFANQGIHDILEPLAGAYVTWAEHSGVVELTAVGHELSGPPIANHWLVRGSNSRPLRDSSSYGNEVLVQYGSDLDSVATWPPGDAPDPDRPGCRIQLPPVRFPEIPASDSAAAHEAARKVHDVLSKPQLALEDISLEPGRVEWEWLVPGRRYLSHLPGSENLEFLLDSVEVSGIGGAVSDVIANWDQADIGALQSRILQVAS